MVTRPRGHGVASAADVPDAPRSTERAPRSRAPLPQPPPPAWGTALAPSQRRAAERRRVLDERAGAQQWLRSLARRRP
jgi:hypothetical protein